MEVLILSWLQKLKYQLTEDDYYSPKILVFKVDKGVEQIVKVDNYLVQLNRSHHLHSLNFSSVICVICNYYH